MKSIEQLSKELANVGSLVRSKDASIPAARQRFRSKVQSRIHNVISEDIKRKAAWLHSQSLKQGFLVAGAFYTDAIADVLSPSIRLNVHVEGYVRDDAIEEALETAFTKPKRVIVEPKRVVVEGGYSRDFESFDKQFIVEAASAIHQHTMEAYGPTNWPAERIDFHQLFFRNAVHWNQEGRGWDFHTVERLRDVMTVIEEYPAITEVGVKKAQEEFASIMIKDGALRAEWRLLAPNVESVARVLEDDLVVNNSFKSWSQSDERKELSKWCDAHSVGCEFHEPLVAINVRYNRKTERIIRAPKVEDCAIECSGNVFRLEFVRLTLK